MCPKPFILQASETFVQSNLTPSQQHLGENVVRCIAMDGKCLCRVPTFVRPVVLTLYQVPRVLSVARRPLTLVPPSPFPSVPRLLVAS